MALGGGNTDALQAEVDRREAALQAANDKAAQAQSDSQAAIAATEAQMKIAQDTLKVATDAAAAAQIKNTPESAKTGVQSINVGASVANLPDFVVTTRDFEIGKDNVIARADTASNNLLPKVGVNISGAGDKALSDGFMSHDDSTSISTELGKLPLTYLSVYKDYGDDLRIVHIDGAASLSGIKIPVDGVAVIGKATQSENIPKAGIVGYTGDATHRTLGLGNSIEFGSSVFTADFVAKSVKGNLAFSKAGNIALSADIKGNQISGSAANNGGYATEGGFYGGDAQYLGGVYEGNGVQGTYGAKSDDQVAADQAAVDAQSAVDVAQAAIAIEQAKADAAKAAAEKAQVDATKALVALERAKENLANVGEGGSGGLEAALEAARLAEVAQVAAENLAEKASVAQKTAEAATLAAKNAQQSAEDDLATAQDVADKAIGEAKAEADDLVAKANIVLEKAKADTQLANTAKAEAQASTVTANQQKDAAIDAKNAAEARAKTAEDALAASKELPDAPSNPDIAASNTITGIQSNNLYQF